MTSASPDIPPSSFWHDITAHAITTGLLVAFVGYASSVAVVIQGLSAVGATSGQVASGLVALAIVKGAIAIALSLRSRVPISIAWSTPGLALLASTGAVAGGFPAAVGAFIVTGLLIVVAGFFKPIQALVAALPKSIANGMLAGILLKLCLAPFLAIPQKPALALLVLATWLLIGRLNRLFAVPAAVLVALAGTALESGGTIAPVAPALVFVAPVFTIEAMISIALPLFVVTMASQNVPGIAVLAANGYRAPVRATFLATGGASALSAVFGAPTINFAAITAALCAGPDGGPDPAKRYVAAVVAGAGYVALGGIAGIAAALVLSSPPILVQAVAGLALIGALGGAMTGAVERESERLPAVATLLVTASGIAFWGIGSAFWGLLLGIAIYFLEGAGRKRRAES